MVWRPIGIFSLTTQNNTYTYKIRNYLSRYFTDDFKYDNKKVMTYIMAKKTKLAQPTTHYLNVIKQGYKDCKLNIKSLNDSLSQLKHIPSR